MRCALSELEIIDEHNTENDTFVYVKDINLNVRVNRDGLEHGLSRRAEDTAIATMKIGDLLKNSIAVNETNGRVTDKKATEMSYVLLAVGQNKKGPYLARIIVDKNMNTVSEISTYGLYAIRAKKDGTLFMPKGNEGEGANATIPYLGSTISIAELFDGVKSLNLANEVFSKDVASKLGVQRHKGDLTNGLRYAIPEDVKDPLDTSDSIKLGTPSQYKASFKDKIFSAKTSAVIDFVDEMHGAEIFLKRSGVENAEVTINMMRVATNPVY